MITTRAGALIALLAAPLLAAGAAGQEPETEEAGPECPLREALFDREIFERHLEGEDLRFDPADLERHLEELRSDFEWSPGDTVRVQRPRVAVRPPLAGILGAPAPARYGLRLHDLDEELGRYFGGSDGVLVLDVRDDPALELEPGDVIVSIDGRAVENAAHAVRILQSYEPDEEMELEVRREGSALTVRGRAP